MDVMNAERSGTTYNCKMPKGYLNEEQRERWKPYHKVLSGNMSKQHYKTICEIHADVFAHPYHEPCTCSPKRIKNWITQIDEKYEARNSN